MSWVALAHSSRRHFNALLGPLALRQRFEISKHQIERVCAIHALQIPPEFPQQPVIENHVEHLGLELRDLSAFPGAPEVDEDGKTFEDNARKKAVELAKALGKLAYDVLVELNMWLSWLRRKLGVPGYWSLAGYAKRRMRTAVSFVSNFEDALVRHARERGFDGVICGHIHVAAMRERDGITYINCGDWVDSCTAVVEHCDGRMELVRWTEPMARVLEPLPAPKGEPAPVEERLPAPVS